MNLPTVYICLKFLYRTNKSGYSNLRDYKLLKKCLETCIL